MPVSLPTFSFIPFSFLICEMIVYIFMSLSLRTRYDFIVILQMLYNAYLKIQCIYLNLNDLCGYLYVSMYVCS